MFSERLKSTRKSKKLSQVDLAKKIGVSQVVISSYETDNSKPSSDNLVKLVEVLNVSSDYLLGITSEYNQNEKDNIKILTTRLEMIYKEFHDILDIKFEKILNEIEKL